MTQNDWATAVVLVSAFTIFAFGLYLRGRAFKTQTFKGVQTKLIKEFKPN